MPRFNKIAQVKDRFTLIFIDYKKELMEMITEWA